MPYATHADAQKRYGSTRLSTITPTADGQSEEQFWNARLASASSEIDSYLRRAGYTLPISADDLPNEAGLLRDLCIDIALEGAEVAKAGKATPIVEASAKARIRLGAIGDGVVRLSLAVGDPVIAASTSSDSPFHESARYPQPYRNLGSVMRAARNLPGR